MTPTPVLLPGKSHGQRSVVGCSPWGHKESDMMKRLHFNFSLSCIGEGNGNPLQCSCLENPRDRRACWAAIYGVAQSQTRLKRLSSSSSSSVFIKVALYDYSLLQVRSSLTLSVSLPICPPPYVKQHLPNLVTSKPLYYDLFIFLTLKSPVLHIQLLPSLTCIFSSRMHAA